MRSTKDVNLQNVDEGAIDGHPSTDMWDSIRKSTESIKRDYMKRKLKHQNNVRENSLILETSFDKYFDQEQNKNLNINYEEHPEVQKPYNERPILEFQNSTGIAPGPSEILAMNNHVRIQPVQQGLETDLQHHKRSKSWWKGRLGQKLSQQSSFNNISQDNASYKRKRLWNSLSKTFDKGYRRSKKEDNRLKQVRLLLTLNKNDDLTNL